MTTDESIQFSRQARYERKKTAETADCGPIDTSRIDTERRKLCERDLFTFLVSYFPFSTGLRPFSEDHRRVIQRMQSCILYGGRYANIVYRGFAKTTITENSAIWAVLYGHRRFPAIFAANSGAARGIILSIKRELAENDLLADDFPGVCQPIRALEGKSQRCASQTCDGLPTFIEWTADRIALPWITGSDAGGAIIAAHGLTSSILGMKHKLPDGTQQRPDFAIIDDPQTREIAFNPSQVEKRIGIIKASILKLAGHRQEIACVVNATVSAEDDVPDHLLDRKKSPSWQSERIPMVKSWSSAHETLWLGQYAEIRHGFNPELPGDYLRARRAANEFYKKNREEMDSGCEISWEWCYKEIADSDDDVPELSAIQHAYNQLIDDGPDVFASECQCDPLKPTDQADMQLTKELLTSKVTSLPRNTVPQESSFITAAVDVGRILWWVVVAWKSDFTGHVLDYGTYPNQPGGYFTNTSAKRTIKRAHPGMGEEAALRAALDAVHGELSEKAWYRTDGTVMKLDRCCYDANWMSDVVYSWAESSKNGSLILPSHGKFYGASSRLMIADYKLDPGERRGPTWLYTRGRNKSRLRHLLIDTNASKSFVAKRLESAVGDQGSLTIFHDPHGHAMLFDHLTAETCILAQTSIRAAYEWRQTPNRDNHWLDAVSMSAVAASFAGAKLGAMVSLRKTKKRHIKASYLKI